MLKTLDEVEELWMAYRDFDQRYTPMSIRQDYERRLLEAVPWLIEQVRKNKKSKEYNYEQTAKA